MRNENSQALSHSSRVKALAVILETDIKGDISDNITDFVHRKNVYIASKYQKALAKSSSVIFSYVFEAFKDTTVILLSTYAILSLP